MIDIIHAFIAALAVASFIFGVLLVLMEMTRAFVYCAVLAVLAFARLLRFALR